MFQRKEIENLLFIDIETICKFKTYDEFVADNPKLASLFDLKMDTFLKNDDLDLSKDERYFKKSSLFPEFSKVLTISFGTLKWNDELGGYQKTIKNIIDRDESVVLSRFAAMLEAVDQKKPTIKFCGHNIDAFDIPFLIKRMLINNISIPKKLQLHNLKPWDYPTIDTMKFWKFGSFEWTSLDTVCTVMNIPSPKTDEVNNKVISELFYSQDPDALKKINEYCNNDVDAVMNLMVSFSRLG
jgi:DNA polymerase elongation subunit (family B)